MVDQAAFHPEGAGLDAYEDMEPIEALFAWADLERSVTAADLPVTERYGSGDAEGETILCLANGVNLHYQGDGRRAALRSIRGRHGSEADRALIRRGHPRWGRRAARRRSWVHRPSENGILGPQSALRGDR